MSNEWCLMPGPWSASATSELVRSPLLPAPIFRPQRASLRASDTTWGKQVPRPRRSHGAWPTQGVGERGPKGPPGISFSGESPRWESSPICLHEHLEGAGCHDFRRKLPAGVEPGPGCPRSPTPHPLTPCRAWPGRPTQPLNRVDLGLHPDFLLTTRPFSSSVSEG